MSTESKTRRESDKFATELKNIGSRILKGYWIKSVEKKENFFCCRY